MNKVFIAKITTPTPKAASTTMKSRIPIKPAKRDECLFLFTASLRFQVPLWVLPKPDAKTLVNMAS